MKTLVIYDIVDDKYRLKVANKCKDYGLTRIQYSAFFGEMTTNRREELMMALHKILGRHWGRIHFFPLCDKDLRLMKVLEVGYSEEIGGQESAEGAAGNYKGKKVKSGGLILDGGSKLADEHWTGADL